VGNDFAIVSRKYFSRFIGQLWKSFKDLEVIAIRDLSRIFATIQLNYECPTPYLTSPSPSLRVFPD
jgi:hypothetical protein